MSKKNDIDLVELQWKVDSVVVNSVVVAIDLHYSCSVVVNTSSEVPEGLVWILESIEEVVLRKNTI